MINPVYNLPELNFVGGESQILMFNLLTASGTSFDADGCEIGFAVVNYANKNGMPILSKTATKLDDKDGYSSIARIELTPADTVYMFGRYVYQITVYDIDGKTEIPGQGIINIIRNIHPDFITGDFVDTLPDEDRETIKQIKLKVEALENNKADNIIYDKETQNIHLIAGSKYIGDPIDVGMIFDTSSLLGYEEESTPLIYEEDGNAD